MIRYLISPPNKVATRLARKFRLPSDIDRTRTWQLLAQAAPGDELQETSHADDMVFPSSVDGLREMYLFLAKTYAKVADDPKLLQKWHDGKFAPVFVPVLGGFYFDQHPGHWQAMQPEKGGGS